MIAASEPGRTYKQRLLESLEIERGHAVLDVGCGPGTDLATLATAVTDAGSVVGLDRDPAMVDEARRRTADHPNVVVHAGDAHALPLGDACVDRARVDRVLQHVAEPAGVLAEVRRVIRPGGLIGLAEPDWETLVVDDVDGETSRAYARSFAASIRHPAIGRSLKRLATEAGFAVRSLEVTAVVHNEFATADRGVGLRRHASALVRDGVVDGGTAQRWLDRLSVAPFLATFMFHVVTAEAR